MPNHFIFDINKCVGCHACAIGCSLENQTPDLLNWRQIETYNPYHHPALPLFHLSLACNHCHDAPCIKNCPAKALYRDKETGAVLVNQDRCIGCKYCTWACPYDAPRFNPETHTIEKCTFCQPLIKQGKKPACVDACPVGALDFQDIDEDHEIQHVEGFPPDRLRPAVKFVPLREKSKKAAFRQVEIENEQNLVQEILPLPESKISFRKEWILALFTLLAAALTGISGAYSLTPMRIDPYIFLGAGLLGMALSTLHLGKKERAYLSVSNLKSSWLSREILFFGFFLAVAGVNFLFLPAVRPLSWGATFFGFLALFSVDMVYRVAIRKTPIPLHSAHVVLSGLLFSALFAEKYGLLVLFSGVKLALYLYRKIYFALNEQNPKPLLSLLRLVLGFALPFALWFLNPPYGYFLFIFSIVAGEAIDRAEFYSEQQIQSPQRESILAARRRLKTEHQPPDKKQKTA